MGGDAHRLEPGALTQRLIVSGRAEVPCRADEIQLGCLAPGFAARSARPWHRSDFLLDGAFGLRIHRRDFLGHLTRRQGVADRVAAPAIRPCDG